MSRLSSNSEEYRERIEARNLYSPEDPYRLREDNVIRAIDSIASVLSPFGAPDIGNSIIGRLANPINTPIQQIGLEMLAKQFGYTVSSLAKAEYLPSVSFANLFDGDPDTKLLTKKVDFQITRRADQTGVGRFLEEITGAYRSINPFSKNPSNLDYFNQTGFGQQIILVDNLNKSIYKPSSEAWTSAVDGAGLKYGTPTELAPQVYFVGLNSNLYPYETYSFGLNVTDPGTLNRTLNNEKQSFINTLNGKSAYEYGSTQQYLDGFGRTNIVSNSDKAGNYLIDDQDNGLSDDTGRKIIWGRDGTDSKYDSIIEGFDKNPNKVPTDKAQDQDLTSKTYNGFNDRFVSADAPKTGLLNYTKELLNSRGKYGNFDLTKKKFLDRDGNLHFQGLPLSRNAEGSIDRSRQHNITDPYDRFAKAIRFKGNEIYGGNQNSVIHKSVTPKLAPSYKEDGSVDIKNLMFSIENLAFQVSPSGNILDGERAVKIPDCEIGSNFGRLMWFAPYDIKFSEQAIAKHNDTVFLGRSEPIYTYNNTERMANLSFKLLIDYPPQIRRENLDTHSQKARFFAFGTEGQEPRPTDIGQKEKEKTILTDQIEEPAPPVPAVNVLPISKLKFHFPNDIPKIGGVASAVSGIIVEGYEDGIGSNDSYPNDQRLNTGFIDQINNVIDIALKEENIGKYNLLLRGNATDLFNGTNAASEAYNLALSSRRIEAVLQYINEIKGADIEKDLGIIVIKDPKGQSEAAAADEDTDLPSNINTFESKYYRRVDIEWTINKNFVEPRNENKDLTLNVTRELRNQALRDRIEEIDNEIKQEKKRRKQGFECTFQQYTLEEDGIFKGWSAAKRRVPKFQPVFHSQTPEDFHRRLTFLQQCVRQGAPIRNKRDDGDNTTQVGANNSVFGRQPVQILRLGDFYHTKVIIDNIQFDYGDAPWDMNPEGMGMQFMFADITIQMKVLGGQSMSTAIDALQNAVSFNYYANSTYYNNGVYEKATDAEDEQIGVNESREKEFRKRFPNEN